MPRAYSAAKIIERPAEELVAIVRSGISIPVLDLVLKSGMLSLAELDRLVLPRKTLAHRRTIGWLSPEQSDRLMRVVRIIRETEMTFGSRDKAHRWLRRPTTALGGEAPLDLLDTDPGARRVETLLGRIAYGIAA
jgi:putative toxin-antitoxin system antitoxin component (TIGR02293 family)